MSEPAPLTQHWRSLYDNKYLGAWNLFRDGRYTTTTVTIESAAFEEVVMQGGRKNRTLVLRFKGKRTPMIVTKTMGKVLAAMCGPTPKSWEGRTIVLYVEQGFKTREGAADVLRIKNDKASQGLKDQLRGEPEDAPPPEHFGDDDAPIDS